MEEKQLPALNPKEWPRYKYHPDCLEGRSFARPEHVPEGWVSSMHEAMALMPAADDGEDPQPADEPVKRKGGRPRKVV